MFWVISVYFNIRNTLQKSGTFLLGHPVYFKKSMFQTLLKIFYCSILSAYIVYSVYMLSFSPLIKVSEEYRSVQKYEKRGGFNKSSRFYNIPLHIKAIPKNNRACPNKCYSLSRLRGCWITNTALRQYSNTSVESSSSQNHSPC